MDFIAGFLFALGFRVFEAIFYRLTRPHRKPLEPLNGEIEEQRKLSPDEQFVNMMIFDGSEQP